MDRTDGYEPSSRGSIPLEGSIDMLAANIKQDIKLCRTVINMKHNYNYRQHHSERIVKKKQHIIQDIFHINNLDNRKWSHNGLKKNKVHCSCPMCSEKTRNIGYKHSDKKKLIRFSERYY